MATATQSRMPWLAAITLAASMAAGSICLGEDKGILGDELAELQKSVDSLPATKSTDSQSSAAKPSGGGVGDDDDAPVPPAASDRNDLLGNDLAELEQAVGGLRPPPARERPATTDTTSTNPLTRPRDGGPTVADKGNLVSEQWTIKAGRGGTSINYGQLTLAVAGTNSATNATLRTPLSGDFDLHVEYTLEPHPAGGGFAPLGRGLGIRLESTRGWKEGRLLSIDRTADETADILLAAESDQLEPALVARPKGSGGTVRVQRRGDRFRIAHREESAKEWRDLGQVQSRMSPDLELWLTAYVERGDVRATVRRVELAQPGR